MAASKAQESSVTLQVLDITDGEEVIAEKNWDPPTGSQMKELVLHSR